VKLLLDTHSFLWWIIDSEKLSFKVKTVLEDTGNELYLSSASVWEMAIKISIGKLILTEPLDVFIPAQLAANQIQELPIVNHHAMYVTQLPWHHKDPFDRMIIAQSLTDKMVVISKDSFFDAYSIQRIW